MSNKTQILNSVNKRYMVRALKGQWKKLAISTKAIDKLRLEILEIENDIQELKNDNGPNQVSILDPYQISIQDSYLYYNYKRKLLDSYLIELKFTQELIKTLSSNISKLIC